MDNDNVIVASVARNRAWLVALPGTHHAGSHQNTFSYSSNMSTEVSLDGITSAPAQVTITRQPSIERIADRRARKKDQNRRAAFNYRRKKIEERNRMREEELRLVYSRVYLIGYADELEGSILYILETGARKVLDKDGTLICYMCPICLETCDKPVDLRGHLNSRHNPNVDCDLLKSLCDCIDNNNLNTIAV